MYSKGYTWNTESKDFSQSTHHVQTPRLVHFSKENLFLSLTQSQMMLAHLYLPLS